jgi:hypothetical protein
VRCPLAVLEQREKTRGKRRIGLSRWQSDRVHERKPYVYEVDTSKLSPDECASAILSFCALNRRLTLPTEAAPAAVTDRAGARSAPTLAVAEGNCSPEGTTVTTPFRYHHLGIPTTSEITGATYLPHLKMHVSDHLATPFGIQWMRFDDDCALPEIVKRLPHVAFEVADLQEAIRGKNVIIEPNEPAPGILVAFIEEAGAPIEFLQIEPVLAPKMPEPATSAVVPPAGQEPRQS